MRHNVFITTETFSIVTILVSLNRMERWIDNEDIEPSDLSPFQQTERRGTPARLEKTETKLRSSSPTAAVTDKFRDS